MFWALVVVAMALVIGTFAGALWLVVLERRTLRDEERRDRESWAKRWGGR